MKLYIDMDGVLANFDLGYSLTFGERPSIEKDNVNWAAVRDYKDFYLTLPPMPDMSVLWEGLKQYRPTILTGIPISLAEEARANKRAWVDSVLGKDVPMIGCPSKQKCEYAKGNLLIDDWEKYRPLWIAAGGTWITHRSAEQSLHIATAILEAQKRLETAVSLLQLLFDPAPNVSFCSLNDKVFDFLQYEVQDLSKHLTATQWRKIQESFGPLIEAAQTVVDLWEGGDSFTHQNEAAIRLREALKKIDEVQKVDGQQQ